MERHAAELLANACPEPGHIGTRVTAGPTRALLGRAWPPAANYDMADLHERMPVILEPDKWGAWLGDHGNADFAGLMRPSAPGVVRLWPVSRKVNSVRNDGPELLEELADPGPETPAEAAFDLNPA